MKFKTGKSGTIVIFDLKKQDIFNLLKTQVKMRLIFTAADKNNTPIGGIYLLNRVFENGIQKIYTSENINASNPQLTTYPELLEYISKYISKYVCEVVINSTTFKKKQPLLSIISDIKPEIINGCTFIDYEDGVFSVVSPKQNNLPNKLYYWEDTGSVFVFGTNGPQLLFISDYDNIEELIC